MVTRRRPADSDRGVANKIVTNLTPGSIDQVRLNMQPGIVHQDERAHLVHVFPTFGLGGVPIRISTILNRLGRRYRHTIVATDGCFDSRSRLDPSLEVVFETMATSRYGLPVVATDAGDVAHNLSPENRRFIVAKDDEVAFGAALLALLSDGNLRKYLGHRNRLHVQSNYGLDRMVKAYEQIFDL